MTAATRSNGPREAHTTSTHIQGEHCIATSADRPWSPCCRSSALVAAVVRRRRRRRRRGAPSGTEPSSPRTRPPGPRPRRAPTANRGDRGHRGRPKAPRPPKGQARATGGAAATDEGEPVQGRHARLRPRGRHRQPVGAVPGQLRDERLHPADGVSATRCSPSTDDGETVPLLVESRRAQRRLHRVDAAHPRRHHVPRRHAARRRGGQVQHRRLPRTRR